MSYSIRKQNSFIFLIFLLILIYFKPELSEPINQKSISLTISIYLIVVILHFYSVKISNWLRIDVLIILGFTIVHFQWPIMYGFSDVIPDNYARIWVDDRFINYSTWLSAIGGVSWILGYHIKKYDTRIGISKAIYSSYKYKKLMYITASLFVFFLVFAGKDFLSGGVYKGTGGSAAGDGISKYIYLFFNSSLIALTTIVILNQLKYYNGNIVKWILNFNKLFLFLIGSYILIFLAIGDRGGPVTLILMILLLLGNYIRPIRLVELIAIVLIGSLLMTLISLGRSESSGINILNEGASKFELNSGYDLTLELANSVRTLNKVVSESHYEFNFGYGQYWIADIFSPIPFAQSQILNITDLEPYEISSSEYITYITRGPNSTTGEGTSLIADIYINFGAFGVAVFMLLFGMLIRKLSSELIRGDNIFYIISAIGIGGVAVYYSRSGLFNPLREIIWALIFFTLFVKYKKSNRKYFSK